ncbi:MAG: hypothetical protein K2X27_23310 [Candidatus Obscuribacterales bacterium]|nr:hypothetical protein [Candidatus Obscuribacterales bacterium]
MSSKKSYAAAMMLFWLAQVSTPAFASRPYAVHDSIEMAHFGYGPQFSPDGRYFVVSTTRGRLPVNQIETTIWLFETSKVKLLLTSATKSASTGLGKALVRLSACTNEREVISAPRWHANGQLLFFLAMKADGSGRRLCSVDIKSGLLKRISPSNYDVSNFDIVKDLVVYAQGRRPSDSALFQSAGHDLPDIQIGTGASLSQLLYPNFVESNFHLSPLQLWSYQNNKTSPIMVSCGASRQQHIATIYGDAETLSISPDKRYIVVTAPAKQLRSNWQKFKTFNDLPVTSITKNGIAANSVNSIAKMNNLEQYQIIDLACRKMSALLDAPTGTTVGYRGGTAIAWSADGRRLAVSNTFFPAKSKSDPERVRPCVVVLNTDKSSQECVVEYQKADRLWELAWGEKGNSLELNYSDRREIYRKENEGWIGHRAEEGKQAGAPGHSGLSVWIDEDVDKPPVLMAGAASAVGKNNLRILDPNPQLGQIDRGTASLYEWTDSFGRKWNGGLIKPSTMIPGRRYPLVIQTHGFHRSFLSDGTFSTANPGRALASRGIVVLQVNENRSFELSPDEIEKDGRSGYVAAIEQLAADGLIAADNVGIIGFSRTGLYVLDCLINAPKYFKAASMAEANSNSLWYYYSGTDSLEDGRADGVSSCIGSQPFAEGLKSWLERSPGFQTEKISAPILFEEHAPWAMLASWDIYAALRRQKKPVELLYMRNGEHVLSKPVQRFVSQETNADWYDFWLNGHEDPDPKKARQYERWRSLRKPQG